MRRWATVVICLASTAVMARDISVKVPGPDGLKTVSLTTNSVSLVLLNWDGLAGGGEWSITGSIEGDKVVLIEKSVAADNGIVSESMSKHTIPTNKVPRVVTFGQTTVTVFRVAHEMSEKQSPNQAPQDTPRKLGAPER